MWSPQLIYVFLTQKCTLVLTKIGGTSSAPLVPSVPTSSSRVPPFSSPFQLGFRRCHFCLHLEDGHGWEEPCQSAHASRQKRDASGKFTRGSIVEVVPEANAGREIPSATERTPEASTGWEIPSAFECALRAIARWEMHSGSDVVAKKTMADTTASSSLSSEHNVSTIFLRHFPSLIRVPLSSPARLGFQISVPDYCY
jgi:hypothetical protein